MVEGEKANEPGIILNAGTVRNPSIVLWLLRQTRALLLGLLSWIGSGYLEALSIMSMLGFFVVPMAAVNYVTLKRRYLSLAVKIATFLIAFSLWCAAMIGLRLLTGFPFWLRWLSI